MHVQNVSLMWLFYSKKTVPNFKAAYNSRGQFLHYTLPQVSGSFWLIVSVTFKPQGIQLVIYTFALLHLKLH